MKTYYSILLLLCITIKPVYFISYVGYFETNKEYIIKKYCVNKSAPKLQCNGKCHLSKQLTSIATLESGENQFKSMLSSFIDIFTPLFYSNVDSNTELVYNPKSPEISNYFTSKKYSFYPTSTSPPPQV